MNSFILFSASWCPNCPSVKAILDSNNVEYKYVDIDTPEGEEEAAVHGIRGLPTVIVVNDQSEVVRRIVGVQPAKEYLKYV